MLIQLVKLLKTWSTRRNIIIIALVTATLYLFIIPHTEIMSGGYTGDRGIPDLRFHYTADKLYSLVESYGEAGRVSYQRFLYTTDIVWPVAYTLLLSLLIIRIIGAAGVKKSYYGLTALPLGIFVSDIFENAAISFILAAYPVKVDIVAWMASIFTACKWVLSGASVLVIIYGTTLLLMRKKRISSLMA